MPERPRILLAEDDLNLGMLLVDFLDTEGFDVRLCKDGEVALRAFQPGSFDLCLLDVMMPNVDGFTVAKAIREADSRIPILFISARTMKADKLRAYGLGADDYIVKPFDEEELLWKIRAVIRRVPVTGPQQMKIAIGSYTFDPGNQSLAVREKSRRITERESRVLKSLCDNRNRLVRREEMLTALWGEDDYFLGRSLDVFITKLRKYLSEDPQVSIENVFGVGFIFNAPVSSH
jgi:DNA-binding response OmpR family regulator